MDRIRGLWKQLRALFDKDALERELDEELAFHLERETEANLDRGMSRAEARRRAGLAFRGRERYKEEVRAARWTRVLEDAGADLRYAARSLRKRPGFTAAAVLTLSLGLGGTATMVSAVKPVLFEPLPYPGAGRILSIADVGPEGSPAPVTFGTFREIQERSGSFEATAVVKPWEPVLSGVGRTERLMGQRVSADYFGVLGVAPALGRGFGEEDRAGGADVAMIDYGLWRTRFGGNQDVVGRRVALDGRPFTIVGVLPRGFENVTAPAARIWAPLQYDASLPTFQSREWGHHLDMVARVRTGLGPNPATRELQRIAANPVDGFARPAWASLEQGFHITSLKERVTGSARPTLTALLGAVVLLLIIACVNVASLLLARGARRREEFAMRAALGADRCRLVRQLLTESLLLAGLGALGGLALAAAGVRSVVALIPEGLPRADAIQLDGTVFATALAVAALAGIAVGLAPALRAARNDPRHAIGRAGPVRGRSAGGDALVVAEVALTLVLLVGAGLLLRSVTRLLDVDPGFDPTRAVALQVQVSGDRYSDDDAVRTFYRRVLDEVRSVPGVEAAALTSQLPLSGQDDRYGVQPVPAPPESSDQDAGVYRYAVSPGYLQAMGVPLRQGRGFEPRDAAGAATAVLSESLARSRFPGQDPIGRQVRVGGRTDWPAFTVVGVAGDVAHRSLAAGPTPAVYVLPDQWYFADRAVWLVIRTDREPGALVPALQDAVRAIDTDQPVVQVTTLEGLITSSAAERRFAYWLFQAFALVALALAAIGIFGVLAGSVAERRRELGVRSALGATRSRILTGVLRRGLTLAGLGTALGLGAALVITRALDSLLFGVSRLDPVTYGAVIAILAATALAASWIPARTAVRVDPVTALRSD